MTALDTRRVTHLPSINLLPEEMVAARKLRRVKGYAGLAVLGSAVVVGGLFVLAHSGIAGAQENLADTQKQGRDLQTQVGRLSNVAPRYAAKDAAESRQVAAMGSQIEWSSYLNDLSMTIPDHVWLKGMSVKSSTAAAASAASATPDLGQVTFDGVALSHDDVASWLESLKIKGFADPTFANSTRTVQPNVSKALYNFSSSVTITADALSGRYTKPGN